MTEEVTLEFDYFLDGTEVKLTVDIGDGQIGGSSVRLDGQPIGKPGAVKARTIGDGDKLIGKKLLIKTLVSDENDQTNWTSVTYTLTGGEPGVPFTVRHEVEKSGNGVIYRTTFMFKKRTARRI